MAVEGVRMSDQRCPLCKEVDCDHTDDEKEEGARLEAAGAQGVYIASDPAAIARKSRESRKKEDATVAQIKWLMAEKRGRSFMWGLLGKSGQHATSFTSDGLRMAFLEGQRNLGLLYTALIVKHTPEHYWLMVQENSGSKETEA